MPAKSQICVILLLLVLAPARAEDPFPQPPDLQPDVDFWISIFTEFTTDQGVMHDAINLAVVYESIDFGEAAGSREPAARRSSPSWRPSRLENATT